MSLKTLSQAGKLKHHVTSKEEVGALAELINRDARDAALTGLSADRRFAIAYGMVLRAATILLYCKGYQAKGAGAQFTVLQAVKDILGKESSGLADYFDSCRSKRHISEYTSADGIAEAEAAELLKEAAGFWKTVSKWVSDNHPEFVPEKGVF